MRQINSLPINFLLFSPQILNGTSSLPEFMSIFPRTYPFLIPKYKCNVWDASGSNSTRPLPGCMTTGTKIHCSLRLSFFICVTRDVGYLKDILKLLKFRWKSLCSKHSINMSLGKCDFFPGGSCAFFGRNWASESTCRSQQKSFQLLITYALPGTPDTHNELIYLQRVRNLGMLQFFYLMLHISQ